ncbi:hypothetical protein EDD16DRAFT_1526342 [Pisolithus croceorrhizus]|nr:hypothetical protein EDD16DRAFT_1526342 [Pisolithus croceorrhizus]KAI6165568.1 hypothetical protein EDD17DRAFT_1505633 [Pisolithus thermaeus]
MSPSALSQPAKRSGTTALHVNNAHSLAPHTCSDAAVEIYASLSQKSENYLFEGYEILDGKVKAPHSGGWSRILESTAISGTQKLTEEATSRVRTLKTLYKKKQKPPCVEGEVIWSATSTFQGYKAGDRAEAKPRPPLAFGTRPKPYPSCFYCTKVSEESNEHETPSRLVCLLWRVFSVFLEDALWSVRVRIQEGLGHPTPWLWVEEGYPASIYKYLGHQERAKRWQSEAPP